MAEIFLGRELEIDEFRRAFEVFLSEARSERPQVFLISGQGGIGKTTLLRKWREKADEIAPGRFKAFEVDWQRVRDVNSVEFAIPDQIQPRALIRTIERAAASALENWWPKNSAVTKVLAEIDAAYEKISLAATSQTPLKTRSERGWGDLALQTVGKVTALVIEPLGLLEPFTTALLRRGIEVSPEIAELLLRTMPRSQVDLVVSPGEPLAKALAEDLRAVASRLPLLISFDTYEIVDDLDPLLQLVIQQAGPKVFWLIAGRNDLYGPRNPPSRGWVDGYLARNGQDHDARRVDLKALAHQQIRTYFKLAAPKLRDLTEEELTRIARATHSIPLAIELASRIWGDTEDVEKIVSAEDFRADEIVDPMVARYLRHCAQDLRDSHALAALALADGDDRLLTEILLPEVGGDHAEYENLLAHLRHRYSALHRDGGKLHDEPRRFLNEKYRRDDGRRLEWIRVFNQRAVAALSKRISLLVDDASSLEELCSEELYLEASLSLVDHFFWAEEHDDAWHFFFNRLVEGLAYSTAFRRSLLAVAQRWQSGFTRAQRNRLAVLENAENFSWKAEERAQRRLLLEERLDLTKDPLRPQRFAHERAGILQWERIESLTRSGDLVGALDLLTMATSAPKCLASLFAETALRLDYQFFLVKDYRNATVSAKLATRFTPTDASAWLELGAFHGWLKEYDKVIEYSRKALDLDPQIALAWLQLGNAFGRLKDYDRAIEYHRKALELDPQKAEAWLQLGNDFRRLKGYDKAIEYHRKALELDPEDADAWLQLGNDYSWLKDFDKAIEYHRKALELDPQNADAWRELGTAYSWLKDYNKAIEYHRKALELDPLNADAWRVLGTAYNWLKDYNKAIEYHRKALELDPQNAAAWSSLGYLKMLAADRAEAIHAFERSIELDPKRSNPWALWALMLYRDGNWLAAWEKTKEALELDPAYVHARTTRLGLASLMHEAVPESLEALWPLVQKERHLRLEAELLALGGQDDEALDRLEASIRVTPDDAVYARFRPAFHSLREHPRFIALTEDAPGSAWNDFPKKDA